MKTIAPVNFRDEKFLQHWRCTHNEAHWLPFYGQKLHCYISQNTFFYVQQKTGLRVSKWSQMLNFCMNFLEKPVKNMITTKEKKIVRVAALFKQKEHLKLVQIGFPTKKMSCTYWKECIDNQVYSRSDAITCWASVITKPTPVDAGCWKASFFVYEGFLFCTQARRRRNDCSLLCLSESFRFFSSPDF